jgi:cysteine synthase
LIDEIVTVTEVQAYDTGRQLAQVEGILSGISTGAAVYAGLQIGRRSQHHGQRIVIIQPSGGERYLSTPMWNAASPEAERAEPANASSDRPLPGGRRAPS